MKAIIVLLFFLLFGNTLEIITENRTVDKSYHREFYETGITKAEGWLKNGSKEGYWRHYHANGKISEQGKYKNNQRTKYWYFYNPVGRKISEGHYKNDKKVNWWLFYDKNGKVNHKCQLSNGIKNGYCLRYTNEKLTSAEKYENGKKIKKWTSFSSFKRENKLTDLK
jgi:antitoxin component YwqK of YwqJK toxin-antitoxin module